MPFAAWVSLFTVSLLGAMSPGPSFVVVVKNTLGGGRTNGVVTAWSHAVGIGVYALLTMFGLVVVLRKSPALFHGISCAGAFYLAWLGWKALYSEGGVAAVLAAGKKQSIMESAKDGIIISVLNPKIGLFFLALFSQVMHDGVSVAGQVVTVLTPLCTDGLWYTFIAFVISQQTILDCLRKKAMFIDRMTGVVLILLAVRIFFAG